MSRPLARIVSMQLEPASMDLALEHFRGVTSPLISEQVGSLGIIGAGNRVTGFGCSISFWESLEALERSNGVPEVVEAMGGYAQWMAGPFMVETYSVVSGAIPEPGPDHLSSVWLRTTSVLTPPDRRDELLSIYEARCASAETSAPGCIGTILLASQIGSRILACEFWSSRVAVAAWDARARLEDQRLVRSGGVDQPPERDILDVFRSH